MLLLGDVGQQLDIEDARREFDRLRRSTSSGAWKDREQDESIHSLSDENEQLKLCVITLVQLLVSKGAVSIADVTEILNVLDPPTPPGPAPNNTNEASTDDLLALAEAARRLSNTK